MAIELWGKWKKGFACDYHTIGSHYEGVNEYGHDRYDTTRTAMGELVYQLKSRSNKSVVGKIVDLLQKEYQWPEKMDAIVPIPSTNRGRVIQPAYEIARVFGARMKFPVLEDVLEKPVGGTELKNVAGREKEKALRDHPMILTKKHNLTGKNILLLDDLYGSGSTLSVAADILYRQALVKDVFVVTMTRNRSRR